MIFSSAGRASVGPTNANNEGTQFMRTITIFLTIYLSPRVRANCPLKIFRFELFRGNEQKKNHSAGSQIYSRIKSLAKQKKGKMSETLSRLIKFLT